MKILIDILAVIGAVTILAGIYVVIGYWKIGKGIDKVGEEMDRVDREMARDELPTLRNQKSVIK